MTDEQWQTIWDIRAKGYAVVVFTPEELHGTPRDDVEDHMIERGWEIIEMGKDENWQPPTDAEELVEAIDEQEKP